MILLKVNCVSVTMEPQHFRQAHSLQEKRKSRQKFLSLVLIAASLIAFVPLLLGVNRPLRTNAFADWYQR